MPASPNQKCICSAPLLILGHPSKPPRTPGTLRAWHLNHPPSRHRHPCIPRPRICRVPTPPTPRNGSAVAGGSTPAHGCHWLAERKVNHADVWCDQCHESRSRLRRRHVEGATHRLAAPACQGARTVRPPPIEGSLAAASGDLGVVFPNVRPTNPTPLPGLRVGWIATGTGLPAADGPTSLAGQTSSTTQHAASAKNPPHCRQRHWSPGMSHRECRRASASVTAASP